MKEGFNDSIAGNDYQMKSCIIVEIFRNDFRKEHCISDTFDA